MEVKVRDLKKGDRVWMGFVTSYSGVDDYFTSQYEVVDPGLQVVDYVSDNKLSERLTIMPLAFSSKEAALEYCIRVLKDKMQSLQTVINRITEENTEFEG